jgi:GTP-binding protein
VAEELPLVVIVGRPNVGKSTLFNRLTGTRRSIVTNEPGITRDRIYGTATWEGRTFDVVDTGGIVPDDKAAIPREIFRQAKVAIEGASQLILVVDARAGLTPLDSELARLLRRTGKPLAIAANKVDTIMQELLAAVFYELSNEVFPVSAEHGYGVDALLEGISAHLGLARPEEGPPAAAVPVNVAIIGRPNVGKSTLLNRLAGAERSIVSDEPGTTRDAVDTLVQRGGRAYRFVDTAGIRRKGKTKLVAEKLSVVMARRHLERADVALLVVDASLGVTANDANIAGYAQQSGRSVILVMNKWDRALEAAAAAAECEAKNAVARKPQAAAPHEGKQKFRGRGKTASGKLNPAQLVADYEEIVRTRFKFLDYAPIVFLSAKTGQNAERLFGLIDRVADARRRRISTGELNRWLSEVVLDRGTSPAARKVKIFYITQASSAPPTFVLFTNQTKRLHFSYERFLENRLREKFDFTGAPLRFLQRMKEPRHARAHAGR